MGTGASRVPHWRLRESNVSETIPADGVIENPGIPFESISGVKMLKGQGKVKPVHPRTALNPAAASPEQALSWNVEKEPLGFKFTKHMDS